MELAVLTIRSGALVRNSGVSKRVRNGGGDGGGEEEEERRNTYKNLNLGRT